MRKITPCDASDYDLLVEIWERSVRSTHDFLPEHSIAEIKQNLIPVYFPNVKIHTVVNSDNHIVGFIGLSGNKIEMLFIDTHQQKLGHGSALIEFAKLQGATLIDVNQQNTTALEFYLSKGFHITGRDETDEAGRPYPILHLSL